MLLLEESTLQPQNSFFVKFFIKVIQTIGSEGSAWEREKSI
jgi:hypothetical protein